MRKSLPETITRYSARGDPYLDWEPMPRVPDEYLECVVYLYPSKDAADAGERLGGTGFVVGIRGEIDKTGHSLYVVTNRHVVEGGSTTVRINTKDGKHDSIEYDPRNWILGSREIDLAIYFVPELDESKFQLRLVEPDDFLTRDEMAILDVGIGDDVFFMGRFVNAEGKARNMPTLRFGTIAQIPIEKVDGQVSFLVEARSIPGFSGSPVFVYLTDNESWRIGRLKKGLPLRPTLPNFKFGPKLIGVDWGHIYEYMEAYDGSGRKLDFTVKSNSGLMNVVPVWFLDEMLNQPEVKKMRDDREKQNLANRVASRDVARAATPISPPSNDENPKHREDFMRLQGAAAQKQKQDD